MLFHLLTLFIFIVANFGQQIPPKFSKRVLTFAVSEEASPGYVIGYLNQYVINSDPSNVLRYWIDSAGAQKFQVDSKNGRISVKEKLDRENVALFNFECFVADNFEDEERVDKSFVYLSITDVNDNAPNFQGTNFVNVYENATIGSTILTLTATDLDYGVNSEIVYTFKSKSDIFDLDANNGEVTLKNTLNYEISKNYILRVVASDKGVPSLNTTSILTINILDVNDTNPVFQSSPYNIQVKENVPVGSSILRVHAFDGDTGINAPIIYNLRTDGDAQNFVINQTTGVVSIAQHLDREMKFTYSIKVDAIEKDDPTSSSTADVIIFVQDVNDNNPVFISAPYEIIIGENTPIGSVIKQGFTVIDADILPENNQFTFSLNDPDNNFIINSTTGYLSVQAKMDFETSKQFNFTVIATESLSVERFSGNAAVTVKLENENDNKPMFKQKSYTFKIQENVDVGYFLGIVEATDADLGSFGIVAYNLQGTNANKFKINTTNGNIYVIGNLDFEMQPNLEFTVIASDGAPFNKQTDVTSVYVQLSDVNDNAPVIINLPVIVNVNENALYGDLFTVQATDADIEMNSNMLFMITNTSESEAFVSINATIGVVQLLRQLDFEMVRMLWVQITVKDQGSPSLQSDSTLTINVVDTNDNAPIFNQSIYTGIVSEVADISTSVVQVFATDLDSGTNGALKYKIASGNEELAFEISQEGIISTRNILDRENRDTFNLTVVVQDSGIPALESECFVILKVLDHNDKAPIFTKLQYSGEIIESAAAGTVIVTVSAIDEDIGSNAAVVYSIQSGNNQGLFAMNWTTGELYVRNPLDWEHTQLFTLIVKAEDQGKQTNARTAVVTIRVLDDNDNAPQFVKNSYSFQVFEKFPEQTTVGYVSATDNDGQLPPNTNGVVSYNITNGNWNNSFAIDANFGTIRTNKVLDREALALYNLTITATDGGLRSLFSSVMVLVIIQDLNDNQPLFQKSSYYGVVSENVTIGTSVTKVSATDADEGTNGDVTYLLSNHNDLFAVTHEGVIAVKSNLDFETRQSFSLFVIAQDSAVSKMTSTVQLLINVTDVNDNAPTFELQPYHGTVYEARIPGEYVITVRAIDVDTGSNSHILYSIVQSVPVDYVFNINSSTGAISTNATLNRDIHQLYNITVKAKDDGVPSLESEVNVVVAVLDSNTHAPLVRNLPNFVNVSEAITEGLDVFKVNATDNDMGDNAKLLFHIKDGSDGKFVIDVNNGIIRTSSTPTDYEIKSRYNLTVEVFDRGNPPLMILSTLIIHITDINDNTPVFDPNPNLYPQAYISSVKEGSKIYTEVIRVYAVDHDEGSNAKIIYSITEDIGNYFSINASSGVVVLITDIDRESTSVQKDLNGFGILSLIITATNFGSSPQSSSVKVIVLISDDNDNAPMFSESVYKATVTEGASLDSDVTTVNAIDIDLGFNAQVSYYIVEGNVDGSFRIHRLSGKISVAKLLNKEETSVYNLTIMAEDDATFLGEKPLNSTALVQILISDVNDNDPVFAESFYTTTVVENVIAGTPVKNITATDADTDENGQVWYEIIAGNIDNTFRIDNITGEVFTQGDIDYEILSSFTITVKAEDFGKPAPRKTTVDLLITVANVNDNKPHFELSSYVGLIFENKQTNTRISFSKPIFATDADDSNHLLLSYQITGTDSMYFSISTKTAEILSKIMFDRELKDSYNFTVQVKDTDGQFSTANVTVIIQDVNDNNPQFNETVKNIELSESAVIDTIVYTVVATDKDIGLNGNILYSMQGGLGFFQIDQQKGVIKLIQALDWEDKTSYILTISARDSGTPSKQSNMSVHIKVSNIYDIRPYFNPDKLSLNIHENVTVGSVIVVASAIDLDLNDILTYNITSVSQNNTFEINSTTGELFTVNRLDREAISIYTLTVQATDLAGLQSLKDGLKITVNILDANDNKPIFTIKTCGNDVIEDAQNNTIVLTVLANDADLDLNAFVVYSLSPDVKNLLSIDADRGLVKKIGSFQPYVASFLNFTVFAQDKGDTPQRSSINCSLKIVDVNNNSPKFNQSNYEVYVMENVSIGYHVAMFTASEKDQGDNALINYSFVDDNAFFAVNKTTSVITTIGKLDRELQDVIIVKLIAQDNGSPPLQSVTSVTFYVTDINDERPVFNEDQYSMVVTEDVNIGTSIGQVSAMDSDTGINAVVEYTFPVNMSSTYFRINETTGILYTIGRLDREIIDQFTLTVKAYDLGHPSLSSTTDVMVMVNDVNDNRPQFNQTRYYVDIYENIFGGSTVLVLHASDPDLGDNGKLVYKIFAGNEAGHFSLGESSGALAVINRLDIETQPIYNLTVKASDHGLPSLSTMTNVVVTLKDVNDKPPEFPQSLYSFTVYENTTLHSIIGVIIATDADETEKYNTIYYRLEKNNTFMIDRMNGSIILKKSLDREVTDEYNLKTTAYNLENSVETLSKTVDVHIKILDANDNHPVFPLSCCSVNVSEGLQANEIVFTFQATDEDVGSNSLITYILSNEKDSFTLSPTSGVLTLKTEFDRELQSTHSLHIMATDHGTPSLSTNVTLLINVADINDEPPKFLNMSINIPPENSPIGVYITTFTAQDRDLGSNQLISYSIIAGNENGDLVLNSTTGILRTANLLDYETTPLYRLQVEAVDHGVPPLSVHKLFTIPVGNINDNSPSFDGGVLPTGSVKESSPVGTIVATILAVDPDGDPIYYTIIKGNDDGSFEISSTTGVLKTANLLDREVKSQYSLVVEASNAVKRKKRNVNGNAPTSVTIAINIEDQNDNPPQFIQQVFSGGVSESAKYGTSILRIQASDADTGNDSILHYEIIGDSNVFHIHQLTGWITSKELFAGQTGQLYQLNVVVKDNNGKANYYSDTAVVKIFVLTDLQRIVLTMKSDPTLVQQHRQDFIDILQNVTKYTVNIDEIQYATNSERVYDFTRTDLLFHAVDPTTNEILDRDVVIRNMDDNYALLQAFFDKWNVTKYEGKVSPVVDSEDDNTTMKIIIAVIVCIVLLFILFVIIVCRWRNRQKRKLKAVTTSAMKSDAELKNISSPSLFSPIHGLPSTFTFDTDPTLVKVDTFAIPEDISDSPRRRVDTSSKFSTFYGANTLEAKDQNGASYLEPTDVEEDDENLKPRNLTLLDVIATQDYEGKQVVGLDNKGVDDDEYFSESEDGLSETAESTADLLEDDDIIPDSVYGIRNNGNHNNNNNNNSSNSNNSNSNNRNNIGATIGTTYRRNGMLVTSM